MRIAWRRGWTGAALGWLSVALTLGFGTGCAPGQAAALPVSPPPTAASAEPAPARPTAAPATAPADDERFSWEPRTWSPQPAGAPDPADRDLLTLCGTGDAALDTVAARIAERQARALPALDIAETTFALRAAGSPYVWPRLWSLAGPKLDRNDARERVQRWLASFNDGGKRRCGVASASGPDTHVIVMLALDALADLDPLPTQVRSGQWLRVAAHLLVPASGAKVIVLAPTGAPRSVTTSLDSGVVRATFHADRPGGWLVQVMADVKGGPRPVAEAKLQVGGPPPPGFHAEPAPGEAAAAGAADEQTALIAMINAARRSEHLPALTRDTRLDSVARAHAEAMQRARRIGHDVGDGNPAQRVVAAGIKVHAAGENVAHARTLRRAHRALWASPSHRGNLLYADFDAVGVGVVHAPNGSVWVCEEFADR
jgi:uncharacterized protein YkwD